MFLQDKIDMQIDEQHPCVKLVLSLQPQVPPILPLVNLVLQDLLLPILDPPLVPCAMQAHFHLPLVCPVHPLVKHVQQVSIPLILVHPLVKHVRLAHIPPSLMPIPP